MTIWDLIFGWPIILGTLGYYAIILACLVVAFRRLRKNILNPAGLAAVGILLLFPITIAWHAASVTNAADLREKEVAAWSRVAVPEPLPRALIVVERSTPRSTPDYVHVLAETGLFDVYVEWPTASALLHAVASSNQTCLKHRNENITQLSAFRYARCTELVPIDTKPSEAIVIYTNAFVAPHAEKSTLRGSYYDPSTHEERVPAFRTNWAIEIAWRHAGIENLIYYDESLRRQMLKFHPLYGLRSAWEAEPRRQISSSSFANIGPFVDEFLFNALSLHPIEQRFSPG